MDYPWYAAVIEDEKGIKVYGNIERWAKDLQPRCRLAIQHGFAKRAEIVEIPPHEERKEKWTHDYPVESWGGLNIVTDQHI